MSDDGKITLLIVDDHPMVRDGLRMMLTARRLFTVVATRASGQEAVAYVRENGVPDVIISDVRMQGLDGFETLEGTKLELPKQFDNTTDENRPLEVFRFYPDGGASGKWNLTLAVAGKDFAMEIGVAKLTGAVVSREKGRGE